MGDWLAVTDSTVALLLPRTSLLSRASSSGVSRPQPLAANIDVVLICASLSNPLRVRRIERLLTLAWGPPSCRSAPRPATSTGSRRTPRTARRSSCSASGSEQGLAQAFSDVEELATACRFSDCGHRGEPGCAVQASIDAGDLSAERMASWRHLQRELAWQARRTDVRLRAEEKAKWKAVHRAHRARGGRA